MKDVKDCKLSFPVVKGDEGHLIPLSTRPFTGEDYRSAVLGGTIHIGLTGPASVNVKTWGQHLAGWRDDFAIHPGEILYRTRESVDDESWGLAAALAWLRQANDACDLAPLAASGVLGLNGVIEPVSDEHGAFETKLHAVLEAEPKPGAFLFSADQSVSAYQGLLQEMRDEGITPVPVRDLSDCAEYWRIATVSPLAKIKERKMIVPIIGSTLAAGLLLSLVVSEEWDIGPVEQRWSVTPPAVVSVPADPLAVPATAALPPPPGPVLADAGIAPLPANTPVTRCVPATDQPDMDRLDAEMQAEAEWGRRNGFQSSYRSETTRSRTGGDTREEAVREYRGTIRGVTVLRSEKRAGEWCVTIGPVEAG